MFIEQSFYPLWVVFVLSLAASCISITVTQTELFRPLREFVSKKSHMFGYLFQCFYCFSHWVIFAGILIYRPVLIRSGSYIVDLIVSAFFTIGLSTITSGIMFKAMRTAIAKHMDAEKMHRTLDEHNAN
ncbi:hypothetical protein [Celerinatantimonas sp. MCCC 1A17872]|uniref:hypothetical protein n=1 Tax=Celerinatantimonas sp. MCCC 1A17872 TaxID=3177514 RepID=UPI0038C5E810